MDTASILYEIDGIEKELARLRKRVKSLNTRKKQLMDQVITNMKDSGETEVTIRGKKYYLEERARHGRKTDKKRKEDALHVLQEEGFQGHEAEEMYDKLTDALRGPEQTIYTLRK